MSLWKKMATPSSATQPMAARAAAMNQWRQPSKPSPGSSETSGSDVTTLAPAIRPCAASQGMASPWWTVRRGTPGVSCIAIDASLTLCRDDQYLQARQVVRRTHAVRRRLLAAQRRRALRAGWRQWLGQDDALAHPGGRRAGVAGELHHRAGRAH